MSGPGGLTAEELEVHLRAFLRAIVQGDHQCKGDIDACAPVECLDCGTRDCPKGEPLHYHHDGCPACDMPQVEP